MENNKKEKKTNWSALISSFLFGIIIGFFISPVKKGMKIGCYNNNTYIKDKCEEKDNKK